MIESHKFDVLITKERQPDGRFAMRVVDAPPKVKELFDIIRGTKDHGDTILLIPTNIGLIGALTVQLISSGYSFAFDSGNDHAPNGDTVQGAEASHEAPKTGERP